MLFASPIPCSVFGLLSPLWGIRRYGCGPSGDSCWYGAVTMVAEVVNFYELRRARLWL